MDGKFESVTLPELPDRSGGEPRIPILLLVGNAAFGGEPPVVRLTRVPDRLEVGRHGENRVLREGAALGLRDSLISRIHFRISQQPDGCYLEDAGSTNGTQLDGRRINDSAPLSNGALIFFGNHVAVFRLAKESEVQAVEHELADPFLSVPTASPVLAVANQKLRHLSGTANDILLLGETGAGKEVYARAIHKASRRSGPFLAINCAALPRELAESELFGHTKGAHSMAHQRKLGLVEAAAGGTLFLDEIGDMAPEIQAKLLRFLQDRMVMPLGSTVAHAIDVKVIAATSRPDQKGFLGGVRADLTARLGAQPLRIPPLRERMEDFGALMHFFLKPFGGRPATPAAFQALCLYSWPCNVRELEKLMQETAALSAPGSPIEIDQLPAGIHSAMGPLPTRSPGDKRPTPTRPELEDLLRRHKGNVAGVARALDRQWAVVWRWLGRYEIDPKQFRD